MILTGCENTPGYTSVKRPSHQLLMIINIYIYTYSTLLNCLKDNSLSIESSTLYTYLRLHRTIYKDFIKDTLYNCLSINYDFTNFKQ